MTAPPEISAPGDVPLVGLDHPSWFWAAHSRITGVNIPWTMMAVRAGDFLVQGLGGAAPA